MARIKSWGARAGNAKFGLGVEQEIVHMLPHLTDFLGKIIHNLKSWLPNSSESDVMDAQQWELLQLETN